jgi:hypothetical protein
MIKALKKQGIEGKYPNIVNIMPYMINIILNGEKLKLCSLKSGMR